MKTTKVFLFLGIIAVLGMSFAHPVKKWDFLGQRIVDYAVDKDEILVTLREGTFQKIKLKVKRAPVHFRKVIVHYRNGSTESIDLRDNIRAGGETRAIDLNGNNRVIKKVVFYYNSKVKVRKKGLVKLYGLH